MEVVLALGYTHYWTINLKFIHAYYAFVMLQGGFLLVYIIFSIIGFDFRIVKKNVCLVEASVHKGSIYTLTFWKLRHTKEYLTPLK